jgi:hypothetical protein
MNPYLRVALRAGAVALGAALGSIVTSLPGLVSPDDYIVALNVGYTGFMTYVGLGVFTNLEPTLGVNASKRVVVKAKRRRS